MSEYCTKTQATALPEGWVWHCWDNGSGHLQAPNGHGYFFYDCIPYANAGEIEYYKFEHFKGYWTFEGSLEDFKKYAEAFIKHSIIK